jgi:hypothetical protein
MARKKWHHKRVGEGESGKGLLSFISIISLVLALGDA